MVTCVVLEPDGVEVEWRRQVQDVRTATLQQVWDDQLRPDTYRHSLKLINQKSLPKIINCSLLAAVYYLQLVNEQQLVRSSLFSRSLMPPRKQLGELESKP